MYLPHQHKNSEYKLPLSEMDRTDPFLELSQRQKIANLVIKNNKLYVPSTVIHKLNERTMRQLGTASSLP